MLVKLQNQTVLRISMFLEEPISRGVDKAINKCLDKIEKEEKIQEGKIK